MKLRKAACCLLLLLICGQLHAQNPAPVQPSLRDEFLKGKDDYRYLIRGQKHNRQVPAVHYNLPALGEFPNKPEAGPLDTCATHTYHLKIGNDGSNEEVTEISKLPNGDMLLTGKTNKNGSQDDALLIKVDGSGNVLWMKTYGNSNNQEIFYKARPTSDGGIIVIGSSFDTPLSSYMLICKMDVNGNLQWTRKYQPSTVSHANGADIIQLANNDFAFVGDDGKDLLYGNISFAGNLLWDKKCTLSDSVKALNIVEDYDGWFIASTGIDTGWHVANVIKVDAANGGFIWRKRFGGSNMNANFIFRRMEFINLRPRITGIWAMQGQPYHFIRVTINTSGAVETTEQYDGATVPDLTASMVLTPWAEVMAFSPNDHSNGLSIFRNDPDVPTIHWSYNYASAANLYVKAIEKSADAGFIAACNVAGNSGNDILLVKVDSAGLSPGCDGTPSSVLRTLPNPVSPNVSFTPSDEVLVQDNSPVAAGPIALDTAYLCRQLTCPARLPEDTCLQTFHKNYRSYEFSDVLTSFSLTKNGSVVASGNGRADGYDPYTDVGILLKTDNTGNLLAKTKLIIGSECYIIKQLTLADGNIMVSGSYYESATNDGLFLAKYDANLNNIWTRTYKVNIPSYNYDGMVEMPDGTIFMSCVSYSSSFFFDDKVILMRFDNAGNLLSQNSYLPSVGSSFIAGMGSMTVSGTDVYVSESLHDNPGQYWKSLLFKFDGTNSNLLWCKKYDYVGADMDTRLVFAMDHKEICMHGSIQLSTTGYSLLVKLDGAGNILKQVVYDALPYHLDMAHAANNDILAAGAAYSNALGNFTNTFQRLDSNLQVKISRTSNNAGTVGVAEDAAGYVFAAGNNFYENAYNADVFISKYTPNGVSGSCPSDSLVTQSLPVSLQITDIPIASAAITFLTDITTPVAFATSSLQQNLLLCASQSGCNKVKIIGPAALCDTSKVYDFIANKNAGCTAPVQWVVPTAGIVVQEKNDSVLRIKFLRDSTYFIKAQLLTGCSIYEDSITVAVHGSGSLYLGPDTTLCPGNSIRLHAGQGYVTYRWQDGSTDSLFTVTQPGIYSVAATDGCGITSNDTILISAHPPIPFHIGADTSICFHDTLTITAPPGFINYQWNTYYITPDTGQVVKVFPDTNYLYKATAELSPGCFASDSLLVTVKHVPPVYLGNDTSFCFGQFVVLDAGSGFDTYLWNTGANTERISAATEGVYSVKATLNGCSSYDTMNIAHVYPLPSFSLGNDTTLCAGQQLAYNFTLMQATYLWSSGSTLNGITIGQPGTYWLRVTQQGCVNADTIQVLYNPLPVVNLGNDTTLCEPQTLLLNAYTANASYLWQDGSTAPDYLVSQAGAYRLTVTLGTCDASDTIAITYKALPYFILGKDTLLCQGEQYILHPSLNTTAALLWQDGSAASAYTVTGPGLYYLTATNTCGSYTDSVNITAGPCNIMMPSAFTPNGDGVNDAFRVKYHAPVKQFDFIIYDRWGEKVFETNDINKGWDGTWKGLPALPGSYVWVIRFTDNTDKQQQLKGVVTLLR